MTKKRGGIEASTATAQWHEESLRWLFASQHSPCLHMYPKNLIYHS
ncbi:hypothetical protein [Candidatus Sarmatiella mevalonica]|nr:hypothetical protein [Candidatus Sarmatiella mevalonica]